MDYRSINTSFSSGTVIKKTITTKRNCITNSSFPPLKNQSVPFSAIIASIVVVISIPVVAAVTVIVVPLIVAVVAVVLITVVPVEPVIAFAVLDVTIPPYIIPAMFSYL